MFEGIVFRYLQSIPSVVKKSSRIKKLYIRMNILILGVRFIEY